MADKKKKVSVLIDFLVNKKGVKDAKKEIKDFVSEFNTITADITSKVKLIDKLTSYTDKYVSSQRVLTQTFSDNVKSLNSFTNGLSRMTGVSETSITQANALFGQMATSLGMTTDMASDFTKQLDILSSKISILYGRDYQQVAKSLIDAVKGESSTLTTLTGIVVKNESLQNTLNRLGIDAQASKMNGLNRAMLEYITIADRMTASNELLGEAVNDVAFQKQVLANQVKRLAEAFGNLLYPILRAILPVLNAILMVAVNIINIIGRLIGATERVSTSTSSGIKDWNDYGNAIQSASKKANTSLRSFDKLNNIKTPTPTETTGGGTGLNADLLKAFNGMSEQMLDISNRATEIADKIMNWLGFTYDVNEGWKWSGKLLKENILNTIINIGDWIKKWWKEILTVIGIIGLAVVGFKLIKKLISSMFGKKDTEGASAFAGALEKVGSAFKILALGTAALEVLAGVAMIIEKLNDLLKTMADNSYKVGDVLKLLGGILAGIIIFMGITVGLAKILADDPLALIGVLAVVGAITAVMFVLKATLPKILKTVADFVDRVAPYIIKIFVIILDKLNEFVKILGEILPPIIDSFGRLFEKIFNGIVGVINAVSNAISNVFNSITKFIRDLGMAIESFADSVIRTITKLINFIVSGIEYLINTLIVKSINALLKTVKQNKIAELLGFDKKITLLGQVKIDRFKPKLYKDGGFISADIFAMNENGVPEMLGNIGNRPAVANNDQITSAIASAVYKAELKARDDSKSKQPIQITAEGDVNGLMQFIKFKQKENDRQYGF